MTTKEYNYRIVEVKTGKVIKRPQTWHRKHKHAEAAAIAALDSVIDSALRDYARWIDVSTRQNKLANKVHLTGHALRGAVRAVDACGFDAIISKYNIIRLSRTRKLA